MTKERLKSPRARLFVALDLAEELRAEIAAWGREELCDPALRPVREESLHVTLAFLGYRPERQIESLAAVVDSLKAPAPVIRVGDPVAKPSSGRPRLFALPIESPGVVVLQSELQEKLVAQGLFEAEERPFWPHVTVARVKSAGGRARRPREVLKQPRETRRALSLPASCVRVTLYRSELQPQGARYTPLAQVELSETGGGEVERDGR